KRYCPTDPQPARSFPAYSTEQFQEYRLHARFVSLFSMVLPAGEPCLRVVYLVCTSLHPPMTQSTIFLCVGKNLHSHSAYRLRFTMHHATNPLRCFAGKSRRSAACADASRDALLPSLRRWSTHSDAFARPRSVVAPLYGPCSLFSALRV